MHYLGCQEGIRRLRDRYRQFRSGTMLPAVWPTSTFRTHVLFMPETRPIHSLWLKSRPAAHIVIR